MSSSASSVINFSPPNYGHVWNLFFSLPIMYFLRLLAQSTPYAKQGFFCNDNEIRFPYVPDTFPAYLMDWAFAIVCPLVCITSECSLVRHLTRRNRGKQLHRGDGKFHPLVINCLYFIAAFYCSNLSTGSICDLGKRTASRLRPNFLAVCQPKNLSGLCPPDNFDYMVDYECTNHLFDQNEFFSFPSGHAAFVCNFAVFMILYLQKRCKLPPMMRSFAQFFIALFAYYVCLTRVRDHKHRLTDVAGGAVTGMAIGIFFIRFVLHNFRPNRYSLVDRTDWPDDDQPSSAVRTLRAAIIGDKFSVPQTIVVHRNSDATGGKMPILSNLHHKNSASDYGSLIMGQTTSSSDVFGGSVNGTDGKEEKMEQKHNPSR